MAFGILTNFRTGSAGRNGWSPVYALITVGDKVILQVVDFVGGTGTKPALPTDPYLTPTGFGTAENAVNIRGGEGKAGNNGDNGTNGWQAQFAPHYRTPTEVVLKIVGYVGGTGTAPALPTAELFGSQFEEQEGSVGEFLQADGTYGRLATAARINPEDSYFNRLTNIQKTMTSSLKDKVGKVIGAAKVDISAWIAQNTGVEFTQVDALTVFKTTFRSMAFYAARGTSAEDLPTFPMATVMPNVLSMLTDQFTKQTQLAGDELYPDVFKQLFRAVVDFDGELEAKYLLGDISDATSQATIDGLNQAFGDLINAIA